MAGFTRGIHDAYERSEDRLGRTWPIWVLGLAFYAVAAYVLLTKINLPSPAHLIVYSMAATIFIFALLNVDWALVGLVAMIPFARPGFTIGSDKVFHVSGFNVAVLGVWLFFILRHMTDKEFARRGPLFRRTPLDVPNAIFLIFLTISSLAGLNSNDDSMTRAQLLMYYKEQILYMLWFYLSITLMRRPEDVRRYAMFFAFSGLLVAAVGVYGRISGAAQAAQVLTSEEAEFGVAGGRVGGGWFGLGHPNLFAAFLIMTMPTWFYMVDHLKRAWAKILDDLAIVFGFIALLYTYSRSGWVGIMTGIGMLGLRAPRTLIRAVVFLLIFAVVAQVLTVSLVGKGVAEVVRMRFEQLERSNLSSRPEIFAAAWGLIREHPLTGVGIGTFQWHVVGQRMTWIAHGHNVFLTYAAEMGLPCMVLFAIVIGMVLVMGARNVRAGDIPGYGFLARGTYVGLFAIVTLSMFDHIFFDRSVGHAFYALLAIVVAYNRMLREGLLPKPEFGAEGAGAEPRPSRLWIGT
jgi:putative inorganic carbon (HCO3(-)) transporter